MYTHEFTTWLTGAKTPSIQYRSLVDLLNYPADDPRLIQARQAILTSGPVPDILSRQNRTGNWQGERSYYTPKYISTHWSLLLLAELEVDGGDARFRQGVDYMLDTTAGELGRQLVTKTFGLSCFWGNLLRYALQAGLARDDRVENVIHLATLVLQEGPCRCEHNWEFACAWGAVRTLWGLAAIPKAQRTPAIEAAISRGVEFLLSSYHLAEADYPLPKNAKVHPLWFKLNFPLFYQADILFALRVLDELGLLAHPGARAALDWLEQLRGRSGRWSGSSPYRQRTWPGLGDREETDRWVSLQAARILQHAGCMPV